MVFVWQLSILVLSSKTIVKGIILKGKPQAKKNKTSVISNVLTLIKSYSKVPLKNSEIQIKLDNLGTKVSTNDRGKFEMELDYSLEKEPEIGIYYLNKEITIIQDYPIFFNATDSLVDIISDVDDTILVSHTASMIKRIGVLSLVRPEKRKAVRFTQKLLSLLSQSHSRIFYVSKSESNLFKILYSFINNHQLPKGILLLTPYLNFRQLLDGKKGKDFKLNHIKFILENSTNKKFILFGDDTQKDMEVYKIIAQTYPKQIARIYIRQTKRHVNSHKLRLLKNLKEVFPTAVYFNENTDVDLELTHLENIIQNDIL